MNPDTKTIIEEWRVAAARHRNWMFLCIAIVLVLEIWFWRYPPRGYEATDVITVGEAAGEPLVGFAKVWDRLCNDDAFMADVMAAAGWVGSAPREKLLRRLNLEVRPGLTFRMFSAGMAEVKFTHGSFDRMRPLLTAFTTRLLEHLRTFAAREYEKRRYRLGVNMETASRKRSALQGMFSTFGAGSLLASGFDIADPDYQPDLQKTAVPDLAASSSSFIGLAGQLMIDTARLQEAMTMLAWKELTASEPETLVLAPREPILLTDPGSPPRLVQPLVFLLNLFIPIAGIFLFAAGVALFESARGEDAVEPDGRTA